MPYSGEAVQGFIKRTLKQKYGYFHYDDSNNRYLVFADAGYILKYKNKVGFSFKDVDQKDVLETKINLENMQIFGKFVVYSEGFRDYISCIDYGD